MHIAVHALTGCRAPCRPRMASQHNIASHQQAHVKRLECDIFGRHRASFCAVKPLHPNLAMSPKALRSFFHNACCDLRRKHCQSATSFSSDGFSSQEVLDKFGISLFWRHPSPAQACRLPPGNKHTIFMPSPGPHQHPWHSLPTATPQAWCYQPGPQQQAVNSSAKLDPHSHPAVIYNLLHSR